MDKESEKKVAIIAGAGVAGLVAAHTLLESTDIKPLLFEMTDAVGGISKTIEYKGNRMDIGGHRFFSKSDRVMNWWKDVMPFSEDSTVNDDRVMLQRSRVSRIFYMRKFFDYPIKLNIRTIKNLGFIKMIKMGFSYGKSMVLPIKPEESLEDFFINRFGKELYETFFKDYTEKVWGVPCSQIKPEWGAQRIKGISIKEVIKHALKSLLIKPSKKDDISQKDVETSLIDQFLYPKYGVGQMWDEVGKKVVDLGAEIVYNKKIVELILEDNQIKKVVIEDQETYKRDLISCDYFLSTMPLRDLVSGLKGQVPKHVREVGQALEYRDFISVGLLLNRFELGNETNDFLGYKIPDNWIYVQDNSVKMGRIQIFNNWSPYMVKNPNHIWIGLEYFCNEKDEFWEKDNPSLIDFAVKELISMEAIREEDVVDATVVRMPKAYPSYIGAYEKFDDVKDFIDTIENLFLIGRNGMHRYNNMDHSMLTAIRAVENIKNGSVDKQNIWQVNAEKEYHEEKKEG